MNIKPMKLLQIRSAWDKFQQNHPKFLRFLKVIGKNAISEGSVVEIKVTTSDGRTMNTNIKVTGQDMELFRQIQEIIAEGGLQ